MAQQNESHPVSSGLRNLLVEFRVNGFPAPQGSKRHVGKGILVESSPRLKDWRTSVAVACFDAYTDKPIEGPVGVCLEFVFPRPRSHYRTGKNAHLLRDGAPKYPTTRSVGDIDKLARGTIDPLCIGCGGSLLRDDSQVAWLYAAKDWGEAEAFAVIRVFEL